jgi:hypothetical protein
MKKEPDSPKAGQEDEEILSEISFPDKPDLRDDDADVSTCLYRNKELIASLNYKSVDWQKVFAASQLHVDAMTAVTGKSMAARREREWIFPDNHRLICTYNNVALMAFKTTESNPADAVLMKMTYGPEYQRIENNAFPLQCTIDFMQVVKGFDPKAYKQQHNMAPQEDALRLMLESGKQLWDAGWECKLDPSAFYGGIERPIVPWIPYLRDRYFSLMEFFGGKRSWIVSKTKKRVRDLFLPENPQSSL